MSATAAGSTPKPLTVLAYDHTGNVRVSHEVEYGDLVDWKWQGKSGFYKCRVFDVWRSPGGNTMLRVSLVSMDGQRNLEGEIRRKITGRHILAVYDKDGKRKEPVRQ